ncbi:MAG: glycosidase [Firmicutes bacterium]|nr:glycosidase [Bacillota bacterium]
MRIKRCSANPIVQPGGFAWRKSNVFNPGVVMDNGVFYMLERAAGGLAPFITKIGLLKSHDGINFTHVKDEPVFTSEMIGLPYGSVQDPRVVKIEGLFYMAYAVRPYCIYARTPKNFNIKDAYPDWDGRKESNLTRSAIAVSENLITWKHIGFTTPPEIDDRDNILFPEKINGKFALLRRPIGGKYIGSPGIWISYSDNLKNWTEPEFVAGPKEQWEGAKIGGSTPPIKTDKGWLTLYHGVDENKVYRVGAMLLDLDNPANVIARTKLYIMEPHEDYEKVGLFIPNVIFPTGNVVSDGILYIYYGCTDTCIAMATVPLHEIMDYLMLEKV